MSVPDFAVASKNHRTSARRNHRRRRIRVAGGNAGRARGVDHARALMPHPERRVGHRVLTARSPAARPVLQVPAGVRLVVPTLLKTRGTDLIYFYGPPPLIAMAAAADPANLSAR
jgi:hypothetical protein